MGILKAKTKRQGKCVLSTVFINLNIYYVLITQWELTFF